MIRGWRRETICKVLLISTKGKAGSTNFKAGKAKQIMSIKPMKHMLIIASLFLRSLLQASFPKEEPFSSSLSVGKEIRILSFL